jgi:hypothetical protein
MSIRRHILAFGLRLARGLLARDSVELEVREVALQERPGAWSGVVFDADAACKDVVEALMRSPRT